MPYKGCVNSWQPSAFDIHTLMRNHFKNSVPQSEDFLRALKYFMENLRAMNFLRKMLCGVKVCKFSITCWLFPLRFQIERGEIFDFTRLFHYLLISKIQDPSRQNVSKFLKSFKNEIVQKPFCSTSLESWDRIWQLMSWRTPINIEVMKEGHFDHSGPQTPQKAWSQ